MMKGRSGEVLWDDTIRLGIEMRKKLRLVKSGVRPERRLTPARRWFFDPFVPHIRAMGQPDRGRRRDDRMGGRADRRPRERTRPIWAITGSDAWHGFHDVTAGLRAMTDPNKLTLLMPGFDRVTGAYEGARHPGAAAGGVPAGEPDRAARRTTCTASCSC